MGLFAISGRGHRYYDRGDPLIYDFTGINFIKDGTWHDLDLSNIVPGGAVAVVLTVVMNANAPGKYIQFRKNGNTNTLNTHINYTLVENVIHYSMGIVACDTNRIIEYKVISTDVITINVCVCGWFL